MKHAMRRMLLMVGASLVGRAAVAQNIAPSKPATNDVSQSTAIEFAGFTDAGDVRLAVVLPGVNRLARSQRSIVQLALSPTDRITLDLERFEVVAPNARFLRGGENGSTKVAGPGVVLLRGTVVGEPLSHAFVALSLTDARHGLGVITRQSGEQWNLGTDRTGAQPALALRRGAGDAPDFEHFCTMIPLDGGDEGGLAGLPAGAGAGLRVLNVAVDSDQRYWQLFNDDQAAIDYVAMVLGAVSDIYIRDLGMKVALRLARIWPTGGEPFNAGNISGFRTYWQTNEDMDGINMVHMFSGARDTSYGGVAYLTNACTGSAFGISAFLLGGFQSPVVGPHLSNWDVVVVAHEMGHNLGTPHTHDLSPPVDTCAQGSDERGTIMSYCHTRQGGLLNIDMVMHARTQDIILGSNPQTPANCLWRDCNGNMLNDLEDIVFGVSLDVNNDGIPDECQDCNSNGILDPIDIANGAADVNANGVPDACESDCNANGVPDRWECAQLLVADANGNRVPDSCEPDCDNNGIADFVDIANGTHTDIDRNSRPDVCDDCDANGVADWIDFDRARNVFIAQADGNQIADPVREYHAASGVLAGNYTTAPILDAQDLAFGPDRQLYIISWFDSHVVRLNVDTGASTVHVTPAAAGFTAMTALAFGPDGSLYTAAPSNGEIRKYDSNGAFVSIFADLAGAPWDMTFGPNGNLFVLTGSSGVIELNGTTGAVVGTFASPTNLNLPRSLCFLQNGDLLVLNRGSQNVWRFSPTGVDLGRWNDEADLESPWGMTLMPSGNVLIARRSSPVRIAEHTPGGRYIRSFIRGDDNLTDPVSIAIRPASLDDADENRVLDICEDVCPADIIPQPAGDGVVNVSDLLAVISAWGSCNSPPCPADCAPAGGDGLINVSDLLLIISSWGDCN